LAARQPSADDDLAGNLDAVHLKQRLGKIKTATVGRAPSTRPL
jgi:hypothetical protein